MIHTIIFSVIAIVVLVITFMKLIKENNSNYIFSLALEFIGFAIDFVYIIKGTTPGVFLLCIMYLFCIIMPIVCVALGESNINIAEIFGLGKAKYYEQKNQVENTKKILLNNIGKFPNSYLSHKKLAEWYERNNEKEKASYEYEKIIEIKPKAKGNYLKLANLYNDIDKVELAVELLQNFIKTNPENLDASMLLGDILYSNSFFKEAISVYQNALKYNAGEYKLYYCMGMTYTRLNDFQNAMEYYKKAATINSILNVANLNVGQIALIFKEYDEAEDYFMKCIECDDEKVQSEAYYYLAKIKIINNQKELAVQYANIAIEINPSIKKTMEKDVYFAVIMGKIKIQEDKKIKTKLNQKDNEIIEYLNNTYSVVEKLTDAGVKEEREKTDKEREI